MGMVDGNRESAEAAGYPLMGERHLSIEEMPFDAGWLVTHHCSSFTAPDGTTYAVRNPGKHYAHAHPEIAQHLCEVTVPFTYANRGLFVIAALREGYLRVASLPAIVGITVDKAHVHAHAERIELLADLTESQVLRVMLVDVDRSSRTRLEKDWGIEIDPASRSRISFSAYFERILDAR